MGNSLNYIKQINEYIPDSLLQRKNKNVILDFIDLLGDKTLSRKSEVAHLTSSGFIVNHDATKALMAHHNIYNTWAWTGGHADGEKDLLKTAIKEAKEETGVKKISAISDNIVSLDILPVYSHTKRGEIVSTHLHLSIAYVLIADESDELIINHDENSDVTWIEYDRLNELCSEPDMIVLYKRLWDKAKKMLNG